MIKHAFTALLVLSTWVTLYAAVLCFTMCPLPPNKIGEGRLPSLALLVAGMTGMLVGVVGRDFRLRRNRRT